MFSAANSELIGVIAYESANNVTVLTTIFTELL